MTTGSAADLVVGLRRAAKFFEDHTDIAEEVSSYDLYVCVIDPPRFQEIMDKLPEAERSQDSQSLHLTLKMSDNVKVRVFIMKKRLGKVKTTYESEIAFNLDEFRQEE